MARVNIPQRFDTAVPDFGFASSPLVDGDALYVQAANSIVKLDKKTGETLWRSLEHTGEISASGAFSSPVIATVAGQRQLIVLTRHTLNGVALSDGRVLWSQFIPSFRGMNILTPTVYGDQIFTSPYRERSYMFNIRKNGEDYSVEETWTNKATAYMSSPVVINGNMYMHLANQRVECIDLKTGESRWRSSDAFGKYWSMTWQDDKILALDEEGVIYLLRANPENLEILDSREIASASTWGYVAMSGNEIFVRELEGISVFRWDDEQPGTAIPAGEME